MSAQVIVGLLALLSPARPARGGEQPPAADPVAALVRQLDAAGYEEREEAARRLLARGEEALPSLRGTAEDGRESAEVRRRARLLVDAILEGLGKERAAGMELRLIPAGAFTMGSPEKEAGRQGDEAQHAVRISRPFFLGATEVPQAEYGRVTMSQPSHFQPRGEGKDKVGGQDTGRFPVEGVTWFDALEFCNRLSRLNGLAPYYTVADVKRTGERITAATVGVAGGNGFRLPTEAEWEYACRAGSEGRYHYGPRTGPRDANLRVVLPGVYGSPDVVQALGRTEKVGQYKANGWGLFDMHGNVAEWCWDAYDPGYYKNSPGVDPRGPERGEQRVVRGGSWLLAADKGRSASRFWQAPGEGSYLTGFRVARTPR